MRSFSLKRVGIGVLVGISALSLSYGIWQGVHALLAREPNPHQQAMADCRAVDAQSGPIRTYGQDNVTYYCWKVQAAEGIIPPSGNVLVHFDAHDDIFHQAVTPPVKFPEPGTEREKWAQTAANLNIGNWLLGAMGDGVVKQTFWVVPVWESPSFQGTQHTGKAARRAARGRKQEPPLRILRLGELSTAGIPRNALLHFDLDWFSCLKRVDGTSFVPTSEMIRQEIEQAAAALEKIGLKPPSITIANSPDYCPREQWQMIQQELLAALRRHEVIPESAPSESRGRKARR